ncbi:MAG: GNAT family N-acetyltransferase/peptidase C39 family protein [Sedimenticola sp.]|nr:GNAT family N-acetyltransferase/peptidase C39 family protein [Sedimenticola sp.]
MTDDAGASGLIIRDAQPDDLARLIELEEHCFDADRISPRQFRYLLKKGNAAILIAEEHGAALGDVVLLFSRATSVARLYSIAVSPRARNRGIGHDLMKAAESTAWSHHRAYLRLEVRKDNRSAIRLYESLGYRRLGECLDYYEDHMDAWRLEKSLAPDLHPELTAVPYYEQSLEFTCGAASLMMAMKALQPEVIFSRRLELRLWREATTIFMTSGHGGCGPYGLALAAVNRGFGVDVYITGEGTHLGDSVRSDHKKEVMRLVQEDMYEQLQALGVPINPSGVSAKEIDECLQRKGVPLVLISSWQIYKARVPHWVVVTGSDDSFIYVNDPFVDRDEGETLIDSIHMPILKEKFETMARYGRVGLQAMVVLYHD